MEYRSSCCFKINVDEYDKIKLKSQTLVVQKGGIALIQYLYSLSRSVHLIPAFQC